MTSFLRAITFALKNFWRNIWLSLITVSILVLALLSVNILLTVNVIADAASRAIEEKIDVSVFFDPETPDDTVHGAKKYLESLSQVKSVVYLTKEEALANFEKVHANEPTLLESLRELESNPLGPELIVKANRVADYPFILKSLDNPQFSKWITKKSFEDHREAAEKLSAIIDRVRFVGFMLVLLFGLIGVLIVFNAVKVAIYTYREEIGIMKLVGASNMFIRAPFFIESIFYSLIAVTITALIMYVFAAASEPALASFFSGVNVNLFEYFLKNGPMIALAEFAALTVLCIISSSIAIGKYLKV